MLLRTDYIHTSPNQGVAESAHADVHLTAVEESAPVAMLSPLTEEGPCQLRCTTVFKPDEGIATAGWDFAEH